MVEIFSGVYRGDYVSKHDCVKDEGFAMIPALIKNNIGNEYLALLDICVQDSGELYGAQLFHPEKGIVHQDEFEKRLSKEELK